MSDDLGSLALKYADTPLVVSYCNWRGETRERKLIPGRAWYGATEQHPEPQWFLDAYDLDKLFVRSFAFKGFRFCEVAK